MGEIASRRFASASAIVAAGIALAALLLRITVGPLMIDDAGITFRYARNLALGQGLVFNRGEHVLGTTTPLFAAVLAVLYRIGTTFPG